MKPLFLLAALLQLAASAQAGGRCDIKALDSIHKLEAVEAACVRAAEAQGRDFLRARVTESVHQCRVLGKYERDSEAAVLGCSREVIKNAQAVLSCTSDRSRYREAVEFDIEQSIERFQEYTFIDVPTRIRDLFARITRAADQSFRPRFEAPRWRLTAFRHDMINATAGAGGNVFVSAGLWSGPNALSSGEIAAVMAHEAGHVVMEHSLKHGCLAVEWDDSSKTIKEATQSFREDLMDGMPRKNAMAKMFQSDEFEADAIGIQILRRAGVDPVEMVNMLQRIRPKDEDVGFSSGTHPQVDARIERARALVGHSR